MKKITSIIIIFVFSSLIAKAQKENPIYAKMRTVPLQNFIPVSLFQAELPLKNTVAVEATHYTLVDLNKTTSQQLLRDKPDFISCELPFESQIIDVQLEKAEIFSPDFILNSDRGHLSYSTLSSIHYRGIVKGSPESIVAISIFNGEIMGLVSSQKLGNLTIGKLKDRNTHIIYPESELKNLKGFSCGTKDENITNIPYSSNELSKTYGGTGKCIKVYVEISNDIVADKGSAANATDYVAGLFNQSAVIYAAESIMIQLSEIFTWQSPSPYNSNSSFGRLAQFQSTRQFFNGDIAHLVDYGPYGGVAAGFNAFCGTTTQKMCYSGIQNTYENVPTYSWSVMVVTHEMGHLFGSRHTHACVWNNNNTAIDGCGPAYGGVGYEGNCNGAPVPLPAIGGTIMSYCHLGSAGINFSNGFGPQPGNVIRLSINNATCLNACCPNNVVVNELVDITHKFEVSNYIIGTSSVNTKKDQYVKFDAGKYVQLQPGFQTNTTAGGYFSAYIDGCGANFLINPMPPVNVYSTAVATKTQLEVYPTPFTNNLTINFYLANNNKKASADVYSITGVRMKNLLNENKPISGRRSIQWNSNPLPAGTYLIVLTTDAGKEVKRVVKF